MGKIPIMRKKIINNLLLSVIFFAMSSCQTYFFDEKNEFKDGEWNFKTLVDFKFNIDDTTRVYNLFLEVNHSTEYSAQNFYSRVHVRFPDGQERKQQISVELADGRGEWIGKCSGKNCVRRIPFMPNAVFDRTGNYQLKFEQFSRTETLKGVKSMRLIIEKTDLNKGENDPNKKYNQKKVS